MSTLKNETSNLEKLLEYVLEDIDRPRVLNLRVRPLLRLRQKGNPVEPDRCGEVDGRYICGDDFEYYEALLQSMRENGLKEPIEIAWWGRKPEVVEGHHRLNAAWELNWETIPTLVDPSITDETLEKLGLI